VDNVDENKMPRSDLTNKIPSWFKITWGFIIGVITEKVFRGLGFGEIPSLVLGGVLAVGFYFIIILFIKNPEKPK
jgi:hypothetical protein